MRFHVRPFATATEGVTPGSKLHQIEPFKTTVVCHKEEVFCHGIKVFCRETFLSWAANGAKMGKKVV